MSRPRRLSRALVLEAALELVDLEGVESLTMRRLASRLGVEAMSLYGYVPNKDALLDGVVEQIMRDVEALPRGDSWQDWVRAQLRSFRDALLRHPRAITLVATRPVMSETTLALVESVLVELQALGLSVEESNRLLWIFVGFVIGHALNQIAAMERTTGPRPAQLWVELQHVDLDRYPSAVAAFGGEQWTEEAERAEFELGVDLLLAGIAARGFAVAEPPPVTTPRRSVRGGRRR
jgi:AcrR family transcriptional regulator